ncbi:unnamed protein product, partial [Brenthis ino]
MAKIAEIRQLFEAKIKAGVPEPPGPFDPRDLERVKSDKYLYRVLEHCQNNVQIAVSMLYDIMAWRKTNNVNEISEETVNIEYLKEGIFFPHGRDIDSCLIFIMKSKLYVKSEKNIDEVKKVIIYWLERIEREEDGKKITLFYDMDGCGLNNMDIEVIRYMVTLLKCYYPLLVNYIIVFQLPWLLSAGFKIVKGILPAAAVERLRSVNKDKLKELVAPEQALVSWGGKDDYVFKFIPEKRVNLDKTAKNVTFVEDENHSPGEMLKLIPNKQLMFKTENDHIEAQLTITNMDEGVVAFKIRTTAPEKYIVKPSSGILLNNASQTIQITVSPGFQISSVIKDRFLVASMQVPNANIPQKELSKIWKNPGSKADEYRLKCANADPDANNSKGQDNEDHESVAYKLNNLQNNHKALVKTLNSLKFYQFITLFLTFLTSVLGFLVYYEHKNCN